MKKIGLKFPKPLLGVVIFAAAVVSSICQASVPAAEKSPLPGNPGAVVTIVEFSDFQCPFCKASFPMIQKIMELYADRVRLIFKHLPISRGNSRQAHLASLCAEEQAAFQPYQARLFDRQGDFSVPVLLDHAKKLDLAEPQFRQCLEEERYAFRIKADVDEAKQLGVLGTPTFFINGKRIDGAQPFGVFKRVIEQELKTQQLSKEKSSGRKK